jgi:hypothetical protein
MKEQLSKFVEVPSFDLGDKGQFILKGRMVYTSDIVGMIIIPEGFITDFASIPRIFRTIHPVNGKHRKAAVVHDYLCRDEITKRKVADRVFNEAMKVCKVAGWRRIQMYVAVRIGGIFRRKK